MSARPGAWEPPKYLASPPHPQPGQLGRTAVNRLITQAVADHRITVLAAPAGFGKTSALGGWSRSTDIPVAWLTMTEHDGGPQNTYLGLVAAFTALGAGTSAGEISPLALLSPDVHEVSAQYSALCAVIEKVGRPICLVVDDAHTSPDGLRRGALRALTDQGPPDLRIVLACRDESSLPIARARSDGSAVVLREQALRFSSDEILAAAHSLGRPISRAEAERVHASTGGWAVAVRLALASSGDQVPRDALGLALADGSASVLTDYIEEQLLGRLPEDLADFVLATSICSELDARFAAHLTERPDAHELLEETVRRGLFVDRYVRTDGTTVYGWHALFATACRTVLRRRDPARADRLCVRAAERKQEWNPLRATALALAGHDPALALRIIANHWLTLVVQEDTAALEQLCLSVPSPWSGDPVIRIVRACCLDIRRDRDGSRVLLDEVRAETELDRTSTAALGLMVPLAELLVADDHATLRWACDEIDAGLRRPHQLNPAMHATAVFLLGWTELRLRRDPARAARLLHTAANAAEGTGQRTLARRAKANLAFALAFSGDFVRSDEALAPMARVTHDADEWRSYDGGIETFTAGFRDYWRNDLQSAWRNFGHVLGPIEDGRVAYAALARVFRAMTASAIADPRLLDTAEADLRAVPGSEQHGVPWNVYAALGRARIAMARGDIDAAAAIGHRIEHAEFVPTVAADLAEIFRRAGDPLSSARLLQTLTPLGAMPTYIRVSALLTNALIQHRRGEKDSAHRLLESSLDIAWPQRIARPLSDSQPYIRRLLMEHVERGTKHQEFVASLLAASASDQPDASTPVVSLSRREREVLNYLRGTMSTAEIAAALHVSVNTIKTHQRAIYRKLGVTSRKDAVSWERAEPAG
jgi:LuxR family maltose regulon positive regulatory protein